jgi:hypothetical protein
MMNRDGKLPDYVEIWVNANRARDVYLALLLALARAAFNGWRSARQEHRPESESLPQPGRPAGRQTADAFLEAKTVLPKQAPLESERA